MCDVVAKRKSSVKSFCTYFVIALYSFVFNSAERPLQGPPSMSGLSLLERPSYTSSGAEQKWLLRTVSCPMCVSSSGAIEVPGVK